jgi:TonB family protein
MKRLLLVMMIFGNALMLVAQTEPAKEEPTFQPPEALSLTDFEFPSISVASGTVVLDAVLSETGKVQRVEVRRSIASLTEPLVRAVKEWEFSPATVAGKAITSRVPVALTVRPPLWSVVPVPLPALKPQTDAAIQAEFQAAEVIRAAFPRYPEANIVNPVTIVLEVTLSPTGKAEAVRVLRDFPPLTNEANAALEDWRFLAATFNGRAVESKIVLAFVFRPPISSN